VSVDWKVARSVAAGLILAGLLVGVAGLIVRKV
jgi:hypothetical protein